MINLCQDLGYINLKYSKVVALYKRKYIFAEIKITYQQYFLLTARENWNENKKYRIQYIEI